MIKDMTVALKDLEPLVKDPRHLWNGRDLSNFSLRPREAWANWLITVVLQKMFSEHITFAEDENSDGLIFDKESGQMLVTEHVAAMDFPAGKNLPKGDARILGAIEYKIARGSEYAKGKSLVVFFDGAGEFHRDKIRESIFGKHNFVSVYLVGLLTSGEEGYEYLVTDYRDSYADKSVSHTVKINSDFTAWTVTQLIA